MNNELYEKVMGLLDVAVDMGTTIPQEVIDEMEEIYSDNWPEYDFFYIRGIVDALSAVYTAKNNNAEKLEKLSNGVCDYVNKLWDDVTAQENEE